MTRRLMQSDGSVQSFVITRAIHPQLVSLTISAEPLKRINVQLKYVLTIL